MRIKAIFLAALLGVSAQAQNVFLLGSNTTPPPDLNGYARPATTTHAHSQAACSQVTPACNYPVAATSCAYPTYSAYTYPSYYPQYYSPNVIYIGGPGTCGPNYSHYPNYHPSVIYFGGMQAARHGYNFRHCR